MMQVTTFDNIPKEVQLLTFAHLTIPELVRFSFVNKRAYNLVQLFFERNSRKFQSCLLENLPLTDERLFTVLKLHPQTVDLHIDTNSTACSLTAFALQTVTHIRSFHLHSLKGDTFGSISEKELIDFLAAKKKIQRLTLQGCPSLSEDGLKQLIETHPRLLELSVDSPNLSDGIVQRILEQMRSLLRLDLSGSNQISDAALTMLATRPHFIRHLELKIYNYPFSKEAMKFALSRLKNLESLALHGCQKMNDAMVQALAKNNPNLKQLYLFGCYFTKDSINHLYKHTPQLESLHLNDCEMPGPLNLQLEKRKFAKLTTANIINFSFWDYGYAIYLKQVATHGAPKNFERQIAYMYYLEAKSARTASF